jgi:hypothetical protein
MRWPESPLAGQLCERLGERPVKFVFLATEHPGIPDIEILDKLLDVHSALLTQDRVLHNLAIGRGFQSVVHTPESGLTDRRLVHVSASDKHLPVASGALRDSYRHQSNPEARAITECLCSFLSAHQLKQFRTKRRRIRAHFGSPDNIVAAALTIGQRRTTQGMVGGYVLVQICSVVSSGRRNTLSWRAEMGWMAMDRRHIRGFNAAAKENYGTAGSEGSR